MKKVLSLILVIVLALSLGACGKTDKNETESEQKENQLLEPGEKVEVVKGDWTTVTMLSLKFDVRENWKHEVRDMRQIDGTEEVEFYYFDESTLNYMIVTIKDNALDTIENSKEGFDMLFGTEFTAVDGVLFDKNQTETIGKDVGGFVFEYTENLTNHKVPTYYKEFYTVYDGKIYWFLTSVSEDYIDDYQDDVEQFFNSLQTVSGEPNPLVGE